MKFEKARGGYSWTEFVPGVKEVWNDYEEMAR